MAISCIFNNFFCNPSRNKKQIQQQPTKTILAAFTSLTIHLSLTFAFIFCWIYFFTKQTLWGSLEAPMLLPISSIILLASLFISSWLTSRLFLNAKLPDKSTNFFYENNNK